MQLSFIIPAYNEEEHIENVIRSINNHVPDHIGHETVVIDHGSADKTAELAKQSGATVIVSNEGTVARLRNIGAAATTGDILVFLDADVLLSDEWSNNIEKAIADIRSGGRLLTGSWVCVSAHPSWLEKWWFRPLEEAEIKSHMNTGHMIISRQLFNEMNGFAEQYETGEDYEFSARAKTNGINIIDNRKLKAFHEGYPKSLIDFIKREYWHGRGDAVSISSILDSKVAVAAILLTSLHALLLSLLFLNPYAATIPLLLILIIISASSYIKFNKEPPLIVLANSFIYYIYFWTRTLSMLSTIRERNVKKRKR